MKYQIKLYDNSFITCSPSCGTGRTGIAPNYIEWYIGNEDKDISVFTDNCFHMIDQSKSKINIAWLIESRIISPHIYDYIIKPEIYNKFDYIMTHEKQLLNINSKFRFLPLGGCWIQPNEQSIYDISQKTKNLSIIASAKKYTPAHRLRHQIVSENKNLIEGIYGNGYTFIKDKIEGLKDFRFHIVVENYKTDFWITEKLVDAFRAGCIPIYYGCPNIQNFFNNKGMLVFDNAEECNYLLKYATKLFYEFNLDAVKENFELAKEYTIPEDYLWRNLIRYLI